MKKMKGKKILDLGCGGGKDSVLFAKNGFEVVSLDFSEKAINFCKENIIRNNVQRSIHIILHDMTKPLKFDDRTFDTVYAHLSLHYFDDRTTTKIFNEIRRILKVSGLLFVNVKSTDDPLYGKGKKLEKDVFELGHIRHFFSREYLINKLKGFEILYIKQTREKTDYAKKTISKESVFWQLIGRKLDHSHIFKL
ncbi:MAG: methyltransferase domain-containing protein [Candidatus Aenigmarchaeota archaeon]|nr:methyltransferase domain-containing protein [Candidatus Aenigmarchaeota archaeon]